MHILAVSHTCYNPFIYCWMNIRVRQGFLDVLGKYSHSKFKLFRFCNVVFWQANVAYWKNVVFGSIGKVRILAGRPTPANITMNKITICIDNELWTMEEELRIVQQWKCKSCCTAFQIGNLFHFCTFFRIPLTKQNSVKNGGTTKPAVFELENQVTRAEVEEIRMPKLSTISNNQDMAELLR